MFSKISNWRLAVSRWQMADGRWQLAVGSWELGAGRKKSQLTTLFFGICFLFFGISSYAQCAMCRAALAGEGNKAKAAAVNDGIVYLMVIPYVLVAGIGYAVYRMRKKN